MRPEERVDDMACNEFVEVITDYLEGALPPRDRERLEAHLAVCEGCTAYLEQMRRTVSLVGAVTFEAVPEPARDRLLRAFRAWKAGRAPEGDGSS